MVQLAPPSLTYNLVLRADEEYRPNLIWQGIGALPRLRGGDVGADSDFRDLAAEHGQEASRWRAWAFRFYFLAFAISGGLFIADVAGVDTGDLEEVITARAGMAAALGGVGVYAARLAANHRRLEEENRGIAETLRAKQLADKGTEIDTIRSEVHRTVSMFKGLSAPADTRSTEPPPLDGAD